MISYIKKFWQPLSLTLVLFFFGFFLFLKNPVETNAEAEKCPQSEGWIKEDGITGTSFTFNAPAGELIYESCYKTATTLVMATYTPPVSSVTLNSTVWNKDGCPTQGCSYQDISHATFRISATTPSPSPSPSPTGSDDPTATPTATPADPGATPTGSGSPTETPASTTTPSGNVSNTSTSSGQVLGASTMAKTGSFEENFMYTIFSIGTFILSVGIIRSGQKKVKI